MITDKQIQAAEAAFMAGRCCEDSLLKALEAAEQAAWQGIETAPRDGYPILGWHVDWGGYPREVYWTCHNEWNSETQPTHWRHLPEPPKEK